MEGLEDLAGKVVSILSKYPLCDRCLGRLFARLGTGLSNLTRGRAIKVVTAMILHSLIESGKVSPDVLRELAANGGYPFTMLYKVYVKDEPIVRRKCYICGNNLDALIGEASIKAYEQIKGLDIRTFLVGVRSGSLMELREREIVESLGIEDWESIKREVKREVGKALQTLLDARPNFKFPDALVMVDLDTSRVDIEIYPLYLRGRYVKLGRYISQMMWILRDGSRKYKLSIEDVCRNLLQMFEGEDVVLHIAGREDVDVRMLGSGRPLIIEIKGARKRYLNLNEVTNKLSRISSWIKIRLESRSVPSDVTRIKEEVHQKNYAAVVYSEDGISDDDIKKIKEEFKGITIRQLTPRRVLRRRSEVLRMKKVYEVDGIRLSDKLAYFLIRCDGGLYVKELVNGDEGRTTPSFTSVLGKNLEVLFLDVIEYLGEH